MEHAPLRFIHNSLMQRIIVFILEGCLRNALARTWVDNHFEKPSGTLALLLQPPVMYITSTGKMSKEKGVLDTPSSNRGIKKMGRKTGPNHKTMCFKLSPDSYQVKTVPAAMVLES
jgi:hypothetical protein